MPTTTPVPSNRSVYAERTAEIVVERLRRWELRQLWKVSGYGNRRNRLSYFASSFIRPPLVSDTDPCVACELIVPSRTKIGAIGIAACVAMLGFLVGLAFLVLPAWLAIVTAAGAALSIIVLIERVLATFAVPPNHLRLQDVVAERRGTGVAEAVLTDLLATVKRPVVLEADLRAPGVVELYERVGFAATSMNLDAGTVTMTRPARDDSTADDGPSIAGIRPSWLWPTSCDIAGGLVAATALIALHAPGTWSRLVVVAVATFVIVTSAGTDWRLHRIPTKLAAVGALPIIWIATATDNTADAVAGAALMAGPLMASHLATRGRAPGLGDVKLALFVGAALALLNPTTAPLAAIMLTLFGGAVFGSIYQRSRRRRGFPLGPAIAAATLAVLTIEGLSLRSVL